MLVAGRAVAHRLDLTVLDQALTNLTIGEHIAVFLVNLRSIQYHWRSKNLRAAIKAINSVTRNAGF
jgi:hypothetical protein